MESVDKIIQYNYFFTVTIEFCTSRLLLKTIKISKWKQKLGSWNWNCDYVESVSDMSQYLYWESYVYSESGYACVWFSGRPI